MNKNIIIGLLAAGMMGLLLAADSGRERQRALLAPHVAAMAFHDSRSGWGDDYSTVTLLARLRGLSTSQPRATAMW